ncbi:MAG: hypothetical protein OEU26_23745, partial [Candidatus Tectomicrobia bacterium]|nr:hypothetical protein [Candidatus Tectomicrobia bacterium]
MSCHQWAYPGFELRSFTPGRLRLRVPEAIWSDYLSRLHHLATQGVGTTIEPNPITSSVLIRYDRQHYPQKQFLTCLMAAANTLVAERAAETAPVSVLQDHMDGWTVKSDLPGRLRMAHPMLCRYAEVTQQVGMGLLQLDGVTNYTINVQTSSALVNYEPETLSSNALRAKLDEMLTAAIRSIDVATTPPAP